MSAERWLLPVSSSDYAVWIDSQTGLCCSWVSDEPLQTFSDDTARGPMSVGTAVMSALLTSQ